MLPIYLAEPRSKCNSRINRRPKLLFVSWRIDCFFVLFKLDMFRMMVVAIVFPMVKLISWPKVKADCAQIIEKPENAEVWEGKVVKLLKKASLVWFDNMSNGSSFIFKMCNIMLHILIRWYLYFLLLSMKSIKIQTTHIILWICVISYHTLWV